MKNRFLSGAGVSVLLVACGSMGSSDPSFWTPSHDVGGTDYSFGAGSGGGAPSAGGSSPQSAGGGVSSKGSGGRPSVGSGGAGVGGTNYGGGGGSGVVGAGGAVDDLGPCTFTFNVTTVTAHGRFYPSNAGAIWIEDGAGKFVKSLEVWGPTEIRNVTAWVSVSGSNTVDAVTAATYRAHGPHVGKWNCSDVNHTTVADGAYQACVSFAEDDSFGGFFGPAPIVFCAPFNKGARPFTSSPPDQTNFTTMQINLQ